ncbi:MAG: DUF5666 domain-containing protein [Blastocatellia bacterium]
MQKGIYRIIWKASLVSVCVFNLVIGAAVLAQHRGGPGGDSANRAGGKVTAISSTSITVQGREGNAAVINVTADTRYERNGQAAALADFKVDDFVFAHGTRSSDGTFIADRVMGGDQPPRGRGPGGDRGNGVGGQLQSVDTAARTLTVKGRDGEDHVIYATDTTQFERNRQAATLADFKAGDFVAARGAKNANGQFVAERVFGGDQPPRRGNQ